MFDSTALRIFRGAHVPRVMHMAHHENGDDANYLNFYRDLIKIIWKIYIYISFIRFFIFFRSMRDLLICSGIFL